MPTFTYQAYGLNISSDIECLELEPGNGAPDVRVGYGHVPEQLDSPTAHSVLYQASPAQFLLKLERVASFLVTNGNDVLVERAPEAADDDIRMFLLGSIFGVLLYQRGLLPLHASAIETHQGAVAFAGSVGFGKSTLAAAFYKRGYRVLADDVCAVSLDRQGAPLVTPAYPQLNLWQDSLDKIGSPKENLRHTRLLTEKYGLPVRARFSASSMPLYAVYELRKTHTAELSLTRVRGLDKVSLVRDNTFRLHFLRGMDHHQRYMELASATAQHIHAARVVRPEEAFLLGELVDLVEKDFQ